MDEVSFYYLSDIGSERDLRMIKRFETLAIPAKRIECVPNSWLKERGYDNSAYGCMWGHIKILNEFIDNSNASFCMVFENDVYINKNLVSDIPFLCNRMKILNLDILLTGYLINYNPGNFNDKTIDNIGFYNYDNDLWGSQSYIITRKHAKYIVGKYNEDYLKLTLIDKNLVPFAADWTITKDGNKAIVYPMYAVEEGNINSDHWGQINFHKSCKDFNYRESLYI